jgi:poly-gamma-glutamate capsule biosynthesis protein CapA/YwtB (metallophosphatase superfamily)
MQSRIPEIGLVSMKAAVIALLVSFGACSSRSSSVNKDSAPAIHDPRGGAGEVASAQAPATGVDAAKPAEPAAAAKPAKSGVLELTFVGDVIFGRYRGSGYDPIPEDDHDPFAEIAADLKADVVVGNLETPIVRDLPMDSPIGSRFRFGASLEHAKLLVAAGFSAMSLANNHWYDQRREGVESSPLLLQEIGILPLGAARMAQQVFRVETLEKNGWKIGFCAITTRTNAPVREGGPVLPFLATQDIPETIAPVLQAARAEHDLLVVMIHWGDEYAEEPAFVQVKAAHAMIDAGADMVIGHHPHVLQAVERYGKGLIAYSMGNFLFENTHDIPRLTGVLRVRARADGGCMEKVVFHPAYIKRVPIQHPVPAEGGMGKKVRARVMQQAKKFDTTWTLEGEDLVLERPSCAG